MALEGTLNDFSPFDIMELINIKQKTGLLFVTSESGETITLGFDKKGLVLAQSSESCEDMQLGYILVKSGKISGEQRDKALELQKGTLDRLGYILCRENFCSEADIRSSLEMQIKRVFYNLLHWKEGVYIFEPRESIDYFHEFVKPIYVCPISIKGLLMQGAVMIDEWPLIESVVKSFDAIYEGLPIPEDNRILEEDEFDFLGNKPSGQNNHRMTDQEKMIYELLDGKRTVREIIDQTLLTEFVVCKTLYDLIQKNIIKEVGIRSREIEKVADSKNGDEEKELDEHWEAGKKLIEASFPDVILMEVSILKKKGKLIRGKTDVSLWTRSITEMMESISTFVNDSQRGAFETVAGNIGLALFWNKKKDYLLFSVCGLADESETSRFRAHIATVSRYIFN